jgi:ubiquinone/menaquinone biosynthesis C-methylase UbiE
MESRPIPIRKIRERAALASIDQLTRGARRHAKMASEATGTAPRRDEAKREARGVWALGDYHTFAKSTVWQLGPLLVDACGIGEGDRVLDVATGTGNTAIRAALAGAEVVASDLTPENFEAGRREAASAGVELEWVEADAEALPFGDGSFDAVTSSFGAIFAPDHEAVARELVRVCRAGGTIGMLNFTPEGLFGEFFGALAPYAPPPPRGTGPPALWGSEHHLRTLFGERVEWVRLSRDVYVERAEGPAAYRDMVKRTFGPVVAIYETVAEDPERAAALDRDFLEFAERSNAGSTGGPAEYPYEYLLAVARRV